MAVKKEAESKKPKPAVKPGTGASSPKKLTVGDQVRDNIQKVMDQAEEERKRKLLAKRVELAKAAVSAFNNKKHAEAVGNVKSYLRVLEEWKGVAQGGLSPGLFDNKREMAELLVVVGVYWELAKIYDRTKSSENKKEFLHYLEKLVIFSRGQTYSTLCAESIRKYIASGKAIHRRDFKQAYNMMTGAKCFIATSLIDVTSAETLGKLTFYRDNVLKNTLCGKSFIRFYYLFGPPLAFFVDRLPHRVRRVLGFALNWIAQKVSANKEKPKN